MKNRVHKLLSVLIALIMSFSLFVSQGVFAVEEQGKTFNANQVYQLNKTIPTSLPQTFEAWVNLPKSQSGRGGVVLGNYKDSSTACLSIEIHENGVPRLYYNKNGNTGDYKFTGADVRSDGWTHLAITWSGTTATCYINGENKGTATVSMPSFWEMSNPLCVGGDLRKDNSQHFKGSIKQIAVYKDVRTQEEIKADMTALDTTDSQMLMAFNLQGNETSYEDLSSNGYIASCEDKTVVLDPTTWLTADEIDIPENYDFSFMAIGDTQIVTRYDANGLTKIYDYVVNNVEAKKVKHVMGLGDITDADKDWEWERAKNQIARMDGVVPYSIIRGNHDIYSTQFVGTDNKRSLNKESTFDKLYGKADSVYAQQYAKQYTYCYEYEGEGKENFKARNTVHFFSSEKRDYMVVALDYGPNDDILNWAGEIIANHPYHNVIITTHNYLNTDGTTADKGEGTVPSRDYKNEGVNDGNEMWEKLISKHSNIVLVLSGHKPCDQLVMNQREGVNGNTVTEFLIDPQGMDVDDSKGMVATFYVDENGEDITVEWYSTIKNAYYKKSNNYSFKVNVIERHLYGTVSYNANGGSGEMASESVYKPTFTIPTECTFDKPARNKIFKGWALSATGEVITTESIDITGDITLYAIWEEIVLPTYNVTVNGGTASPTGKCEEGTLVTITANAPKEGKRFVEWYGADKLEFIEGSMWTAEATFVMPNKSVSVTAVYEDIPVPTYKITASAGANGSISKSGNVTVKEGESYTFTFTPNQGYKVKDVLVDGTSVGAVDTYTFTNVTKNAVITVEFEEIPQEPTPPVTPDKGNDNEKPSGNSGCGGSSGATSSSILTAIMLASLIVIKRMK